MTKKEMLARLPKGRWYGDDAQTGYLLDCLEVLGLIEYDKVEQKIRDCLVPCFGSFAGVDVVLKQLDEAGYKIVQKETIK